MNEIREYEVKKAEVLRVGPNLYQMTAEVRGYCLIINNYEFDDPTGCPTREGSMIDVDKLRRVFKQLNFAVIDYENLTGEEILRLLEEYSSGPELVLHDALSVIILSHGDEDFICGKDFKMEENKINGGITVQEIVEKFSNKKCPALLGKPKMFFFGCCRGDKLCFAQKDSTNFAKNVDLSDIFILYAASLGYAALRDPIDGTYFCKALTKVIVEKAWNTPLKDIMSEVTRLCREDDEFVADIIYCGKIRKVKQVPTPQPIRCTKDLYFNPGLSNSAPVQLEANSTHILAKTSTFTIKKVVMFRDANIILGLDHVSISYFGPQMIVKIIPETPASECGIKIGDIIFEVNGQWGFCETKAFNNFFHPKQIGEKVEIILVEFDRFIKENTPLEKLKEKAQAFLKTSGNDVMNSMAKSGIFDSNNIKLANVIVHKMIISEFTYLVRGKGRGRPVWHYVYVYEDKKKDFLGSSETGSLDVADYGKILSSGWGEDPPPNTANELSHIFKVMIGLQQFNEQT